MARGKSKSGSGCLGKVIKWTFVLLIMAVMGGIGFLVMEKDRVRAYVRSKIEVTVGKVDIDPQSLLTSQTRFRIRLNVENRLPIGVVLESMKYDLVINNSVVGSGLLVKPQASIAAGVVSPVDVSFAVDGNKTRTALAMALEKQATAALESVLDQLKGRPPRASGGKTSLVRLRGNASYRILAGSMELPIDQTGEFERSF